MINHCLSLQTSSKDKFKLPLKYEVQLIENLH